MRRIGFLFLALMFLAQLAFAADKAIVYDDTNRKVKVSDPLPVAQGGTGSATQNFVGLTGDQTVAGVKTLSSIPVLPASDPTTDNQAARKVYVDGKLSKTTAGEINALTEKTSLADNDEFLIEDSADGNAKKKVRKSNVTNPNLSNVIYGWFGIDVGLVNRFGWYRGNSLVPDISTCTFDYQYLGTWDDDWWRTVLTGRFVKIAGISTITIHARLWGSNTGVKGYLNVNVGGQSATVESAGGVTPAWVTTSNIDVSGLTNGTVYDITIQLKGENGTSCYCSGVILTAS